MYKVLNGPTYSRFNRPPVWNNETVLMKDLTRAPLDEFPLIEDFELRLELDTTELESGYELNFFSPSRGYIANFPGNAGLGLIHDLFTIPLGSFENPCVNNAQSWNIEIAEKNDFVYILEGYSDDADYPGFHTWYKVQKDRYLAEWQKAIAACREAFLTSDN